MKRQESRSWSVPSVLLKTQLVRGSMLLLAPTIWQVMWLETNLTESTLTGKILQLSKVLLEEVRLGSLNLQTNSDLNYQVQLSLTLLKLLTLEVSLSTLTTPISLSSRQWVQVSNFTMSSSITKEALPTTLRTLCSMSQEDGLQELQWMKSSPKEFQSKRLWLENLQLPQTSTLLLPIWLLLTSMPPSSLLTNTMDSKLAVCSGNLLQTLTET